MFSHYTSETIARHIEMQVRHGVTYMDAVLSFCQERDLEPETIVPFLNDHIKAHIGQEGRSLNLLVGDDTESVGLF